jgi:hypothetical protein
MTDSRTFIPPVLFALLSVILSSCGEDPLNGNCRRINATYCIYAIDSGVDYNLKLVRGDAPDHDVGGVADGVIEKIGWNSRYIIVLRKPNFAPDGEGWILVDLHTGKVSGLIPIDQGSKLASSLKITTMPPGRAYDSLPWY